MVIKYNCYMHIGGIIRGVLYIDNLTNWNITYNIKLDL